MLLSQESPHGAKLSISNRGPQLGVEITYPLLRVMWSPSGIHVSIPQRCFTHSSTACRWGIRKQRVNFEHSTPCSGDCAWSVAVRSLRSCAVAILCHRVFRVNFFFCPTSFHQRSFSALNSAIRPPASRLLASSSSFCWINLLSSLTFCNATLVQFNSATGSTVTPPYFAI